VIGCGSDSRITTARNLEDNKAVILVDTEADVTDQQNRLICFGL
jgi:hypothetical protein